MFNSILKSSLVLFCALILSCSNSDSLQLKPLAKDVVILALGDSLTYGTGVDKKNSFPSKLALLLNRKVINAGVPGNTTSQCLSRLPQLLNKYHPQLVIVGLGGNDLLRRVDLKTIKSNLSKIIELLQKKQIDIIVIAPPKPSLILKAPKFYSRLAKKYNIPVDTKILANLLSKPNQKSDRIHLNKTGYLNLAKRIYEIIKSYKAI